MEESRFISTLVTHVMSHYQEKVLGNNLQKLVIDNSAHTGTNHYIMGNNVFMAEGVFPIGRINFPKGRGAAGLHPNLVEDHSKWWADHQSFQEGMTQVQQTLTSIYARGKNWQDMRDMYPEHLLAPFLNEPPLEGLARTRPDLYAGEKTDVDYDKKYAERLLHWDANLINMYTRIGGNICVYLGYKFL